MHSASEQPVKGDVISENVTSPEYFRHVFDSIVPSNIFKLWVMMNIFSNSMALSVSSVFLCQSPFPVVGVLSPLRGAGMGAFSTVARYVRHWLWRSELRGPSTVPLPTSTGGFITPLFQRALWTLDIV